ncbi:MAG: YwiC-like family protein [Actinobacteria bacterium]|nr:YwiC-like family protein [Actinomycetota bacterium]
MPSQHGAWVFLLLPLLLGLVASGWTWETVTLAITWLLAYPASYFLGLAISIRIRRRGWSRLARKNLRLGLPWAVPTALGFAAVTIAKPWMALVVAALLVAWGVSTLLSATGHERSMANDLLLITESVTALPVLWLLGHDGSAPSGIPGTVWLATLICGIYMVGSVIHVKSLIRHAGEKGWRVADAIYHGLAVVAAIPLGWVLIPAGAAFVRSLTLKPGLRPGLIGAAEAVVAVLLLAALLLTLGG